MTASHFWQFLVDPATLSAVFCEALPFFLLPTDKYGLELRKGGKAL